jgi:hypothetical protein
MSDDAKDNDANQDFPEGIKITATFLIVMTAFCAASCATASGSSGHRVVGTRPLGTPPGSNVATTTGPSTFSSRNFGSVDGSRKSTYGMPSGTEMKGTPRRSIFSSDF